MVRETIRATSAFKMSPLHSNKAVAFKKSSCIQNKPTVFTQSLMKLRQVSCIRNRHTGWLGNGWCIHGKSAVVKTRLLHFTSMLNLRRASSSWANWYLSLRLTFKFSESKCLRLLAHYIWSQYLLPIKSKGRGFFAPPRTKKDLSDSATNSGFNAADL